MKYFKHLVIGFMFGLAGFAIAGEINDLSTTGSSNTDGNFGFPENMAPSKLNDNTREFQAIMARAWADEGKYVNDYGPANAVRITSTRTISALYDGLAFNVNITSANSGAMTFQVGNLAAKSIKFNHDEDPSSGDVEAGQILRLTYHEGEDVWQAVAGTKGGVTLTGGNGVVVSGTTLSVGITSATSGLGFSEGNLVADISGTTVIGTVAQPTTDRVLIYDHSASAVRSVTPGGLALGLHSIAFYSANGTWVRPLTARMIRIRVLGAGGGGGDGASSEETGGGGGAGGYSEGLIVATGLTSVTVTIGAGGTTGSGTGGVGGSSSFGSHMSATGGAGGDVAGSAVFGGAGGVGSGGAVNTQGGPGDNGAPTANELGGAGGDSTLGGGGQTVGLTNSNGSPGSVCGGGGSGGSDSPHIGGVGGVGCVIVEMYQ